MSEYQYYEFQAIDRPLGDKQMSELRSVSTRGRITQTSFVNDYSWGDFKGDEDQWMEKYFDAFLYVANWGTHVLKLRLPKKLLDPEITRLYCLGSSVFACGKKDKIIVSFVSEDEERECCIEPEGLLASLIPLRSEMARGDLRALYLGWLLCVQNDEINDDSLEPPVPSNLGALSASLKSLVEFLKIDKDLLAVAAQASERANEADTDRSSIKPWVHALPARDKEMIVLRLMVDGDAQLQNELLARFRRDRTKDRDGISQEPDRRTVANLLAASEKYGAQRHHKAKEKAARDRDNRKRKAEQTREKRLSSLVGKESALWAKVEEFVGMKQSKSYDIAVALLKDLRDLAARKPTDMGFQKRLEKLKAKQVRKSALMQRLRKAGM